MFCLTFLIIFAFFILPQETPPLDVGSVSQTLKDKKIEPSGLKFGFLGLGIIGSGIVKNLLNSGHSVMVWNRSSEKVSELNHSSYVLFVRDAFYNNLFIIRFV